MLKDAAKKYEILPGSSWMVGDKLTDVQAGKAFGSRTILIKPGKRSTENKQVDKESSKEADFVVINLKEAVELILREDG